MFYKFLATSAVVFLVFGIAFAQEPAHVPALGYEDSYQINVMGNLNLADSTINITNAGFHAAAGITSPGNICANVYVFNPSEQMIACCSCLVSRNGVATLSARNDLISNAITPAPPNAITVKLVSTLPSTSTGKPVCTPSNLPSEGTAGFASGMRAWATHIHSPGGATSVTLFGTETEFSQVPLSVNERGFLSTLCTFIQANGSGIGICKSCAQGAQ